MRSRIGSASLARVASNMTPQEIAAAIEAFNLLEPEAQKGIATLIHLVHKKQLTAQDYLDQATAILSNKPPAAR